MDEFTQNDVKKKRILGQATYMNKVKLDRITRVAGKNCRI